jgi:uncharacterized protein (TIGR00730 family)
MRVAVFMGSSPGPPSHQDVATSLGRAVAEAGHGIVYGGAHVGLMGLVADAAMAAGGEVIGVIPSNLVDREVAHPRLTQLERVGTMHERKARMAELADAFVALPGGVGTLDEIVEALSWSFLGLHTDPVAVYEVDGFWQPLLELLDGMVERGYVGPAARAQLRVVRTPAEVLALLPSRDPG